MLAVAIEDVRQSFGDVEAVRRHDLKRALNPLRLRAAGSPVRHRNP